MANGRTDMSCARVETYKSSKVGASERHNERKNEDYGNVNVETERIPMNVHFKDPGNKSYMDVLREMEEHGEVSRRGLRPDAVLFDEIIFDVNTMYFEEHGGYEFAKQFYAEAYNYACEKYGEQYIVSAIMHADEINKAATDELGKNVYHYHMHVVAMPVVDKEIRYSKRCKDKALVGTVKEVIHQISHSKFWESREPLLDENGLQVHRKDGTLKYRASYSILQDEFYNHMTEHGFGNFSRGKEGSTVEHLSSLQYQIEKDTKRLADIDSKLKEVEVQYEPALEIDKSYREIDESGKKNLLGKYTLDKDEYESLTKLAKEGVSSRGEIIKLKKAVNYYDERYRSVSGKYEKLENAYKNLVEICQPFLDAVEHFPELVRSFVHKVANLIMRKEQSEKEEMERKRTEEEKARQERKLKSKSRDGAR